jgi:hypothetical protein
MIGLLTETIGNPTPIEIPFRPDRQLAHGDLPLPVDPGAWHFRQSIEYSQTANWAVLDYASRNRDHLLYSFWRMGMNSIERGSRDTWTVLPFAVEAAAEMLGARQAGAAAGFPQRGGPAGSVEDFQEMLRPPQGRDARGFILPSDQPDFATATKFANALLKNGVDVLRATAAFTAGGTSYDAGSYVVKTDQAFRPHVMDMFEPQQHPNDFAYPGGPPMPPYDNAGWTLAYQMGIQFDRILDGFDGPFEMIDGLAEIPSGQVMASASAAGYVFDHRNNNSFLVLNRLLAQGSDVYWLLEAPGGTDLTDGAFYVPGNQVADDVLQTLAAETGVSFQAISVPMGGTLKMRRPRVGLWDQYGGSMASGWTRMIMEDFGFDFEVVYPPELAAGNLRDRFDVLVFEDGAIPAPSDGAQSGGGFRRPPLDPATIPEDFRGRLGSVTADGTVPEILEFARAGGTVIAVGSSSVLGYYAGLPMSNHLVDNGRPLTGEQYYTPGSVHSLKLEHVSPVTHGLGERLDVLISHSPLFQLESGWEEQGVKRIGWFDTDQPLRSGWAWGQERMQNGTALLEAQIGEGKLFLFSPKITFRSQSHAAFPLLFNGIFYGSAQEGPIL